MALSLNATSSLLPYLLAPTLLKHADTPSGDNVTLLSLTTALLFLCAFFLLNSPKCGQYVKSTEHIVTSCLGKLETLSEKLLLICASGIVVRWFRQRGDLKRSSAPSKSKVEFRRQTTSIGRFSLKSETATNPLLVTFFAALANEPGKNLDVDEFQTMWGERVMRKHERFRSRVCEWDNRFFEICPIDFDDYVMLSPHSSTYRVDLQKRIEGMLTTKLDVTEKLWEVRLSKGELGSSGAISKEKAKKLREIKPTYTEETLCLFRVHHVLADGVSMSVALGDASDEANELNDKILQKINERSEKIKHQSFLQIIIAAFQTYILFFMLGSIKALAHQFWRMWTSSNPFDEILSNSSIPAGRRSTTWGDAASVDEVKQIAKLLAPQATVNDVFVSCVTAAIERQLIEHKQLAATKLKRNDESKLNDRNNNITIPSHINVVIPVHLNGGILPPGQSLGNKIGGFVSQVPAKMPFSNATSAARLRQVSASLRSGKSTPAPLISWMMAKFCSDYLPETVAQTAILKGNAKAVAVISNVRGFPFQVHWMGRPVEFLCAFLPLPPGIPIGVVVQSYAGELSFSIDADMRAVPDADSFAGWMMEEYDRLRTEAGLEKAQ
eukprot:CAMPEP_0196816426 /NCGR_PEP_ID=MMETSP1362-20130617/55281_1 /TAXON_ID=163516 /ORGANISM="Leptocylindrus danicus, Strain CCMP1856" /LENGTH=609 /DNA_ID=CAMNT_0042193761 /DNA_START=53 /DNA_END=1882 /DNA_ORIENTATION=-